MKLFSKRHNLYNDEAIKRYKFREAVGMVIMTLIIACLVTAIFSAIYTESVRQAQNRVEASK